MYAYTTLGEIVIYTLLVIGLIVAGAALVMAGPL